MKSLSYGTAVEVLAEHPAGPGRLRAEQVWLRASSPTPEHEIFVPHGFGVEEDHAAVPGAGDDVRHGEAGGADVGPGARRRTPQCSAQGVAGVLHHQQAVAVGDGAEILRRCRASIPGVYRLLPCTLALINSSHTPYPEWLRRDEGAWSVK